MSGPEKDKDIVFTARLTKDDWNAELKAWRCPALAIPKAEVGDLFVEGNRVDKEKYQVIEGPPSIRWIPPDPPDRLVAQIRLSERLSLQADTDRWKLLAIVLPPLATIIVALIGAIAVYFPKPPVSFDSANFTDHVTATFTEYESNESPPRITYTVAVKPPDPAKFIKRSEQSNYKFVVGIRARSPGSLMDGRYEHAYGPYPFDTASPEAPPLDDGLRAIIATRCVDFVVFRVLSARFADVPFKLPFVPTIYSSDLRIVDNRSEGTGCPG
jgi:hypothetical protein